MHDLLALHVVYIEDPELVFAGAANNDLVLLQLIKRSRINKGLIVFPRVIPRETLPLELTYPLSTSIIPQLDLLLRPPAARHDHALVVIERVAADQRPVNVPLRLRGPSVISIKLPQVPKVNQLVSTGGHEHVRVVVEELQRVDPIAVQGQLAGHHLGRLALLPVVINPDFHVLARGGEFVALAVVVQDMDKVVLLLEFGEDFF